MNDLTSIEFMCMRDPKKAAMEIQRLRERLTEVKEGVSLLMAQYTAVDEYKMGGKLTNKPFLMLQSWLNNEFSQDNQR